MKMYFIKIFVGLAILTALANFFLDAKAEEQVLDNSFPKNRIIDATECTRFIPHGRKQFMYCLNILVICQSNIIQNPIGKIFAFKVLVPQRLDSGKVKLVEEIWNTEWKDTKAKNWCDNFHKK